MTKWKAGDMAYVVENNIHVREVTIVKVAAGFCTVKFSGSAGGMKVREGRLFANEKDAEASIPGKQKKPITPWD